MSRSDPNAPTYVYGDATFAYEGLPLTTTTFTAIAHDGYGRWSTNTVNVNISTNVTFQYDGNGNLTNDGLRNFVYDDENELIQVSVSNQWMSQFSYDGKMRRRIRKEYTSNGSGWTQTNQVNYVYDGNLVVQERDANNLPTVTYTRGKDLSGSIESGLPAIASATAGGIGGLLARTSQPYADGPLAGHAFYHSDINGNVTALIDSSQGIVAKYLYDAFGNTLSAAGLLANANVYRFSSKEWHQNSGLVYYLYRYYDPNLQRWINRDPIQELGGINLYGFVGNNPINRIDPYGLSWYNPWSWGLWDSIANQVYPQPSTPATTPPSNAANSLVDPEDAALDQALANGATPGSLYPGAGQQTVDALSQAGKDALSDAAQLAIMAIPGGAEEEEMAAASKLAKAAEKCEKHHLLPRQFANNFKRVGLNPDDYTMDLSAAQHRLLPDGIHTGPAADSWNGQWNQFFQNNPNYTQQDVLNQLSSMQQQFGLK